jgi:hypothetical protein
VDVGAGVGSAVVTGATVSVGGVVVRDVAGVVVSVAGVEVGVAGDVVVGVVVVGVDLGMVRTTVATPPGSAGSEDEVRV